MPRRSPRIVGLRALRHTALALLPALLAACGGTGPPLPTFPVPGAEPTPADLRDALQATAASARDTVLVEALYRSGLTPAFDGRFRLASGPLVAFIPGRHPVLRDSLVVAAAERGTPGAAALLAEARLLNARAAFTTVPSRTVLVAFLPPNSGAAGLTSVLDAPVWTRRSIAVTLVVGEENGGYEAAAQGAPVRVLAPPEGTRGDVATALALARTLRGALEVTALDPPLVPEGPVPVTSE